MTLALVYAERHPERTLGMVLAVVTSGRWRETQWITRDKLGLVLLFLGAGFSAAFVDVANEVLVGVFDEFEGADAGLEQGSSVGTEDVVREEGVEPVEQGVFSNEEGATGWMPVGEVADF